MVFEKKLLSVVVPLDPAEGSRYIELVGDYESDDDLDKIYLITTRDQGWINMTAYGCIPWDHNNSCTSDSDEELEHWQN